MDVREELGNILKNIPERIIISNKSEKGYAYRKIEVRRMKQRGETLYQITFYTEKQAFQKNVSKEELAAEILEIFPDSMRQLNIFFSDCEISYKFTKHGKLLKNKRMIVRTETKGKMQEGHNRSKNYILKEGTVIPPLVDMGIFTVEGKVVKSMYDKFKQINRFVELVDDVLKDRHEEEINIIDFGCGKSYLTFILYYYLVEIRGKRANIVGLDLKEDVIAKCNEAARKYGYQSLRFEMGDINGYQADFPVDMVVTLHACDTATDYALQNAVSWNAKYILSVPCCQHEVNEQIDCEGLRPMMKYGIIKERTAALATDAIRGAMLEYQGYKTQLLEFVDFSHSPKNILIRAVKGNISGEKRSKSKQEAEQMCKLLQIEPTIYKLLS